MRFFAYIALLVCTSVAYGQVAFDAASVSVITTGTDISLSHNPVGTPRAVIVFIAQNANSADQVTGVTYGGTSMTEMTGSPNLKAATENGGVYAYFLGASIPTDDPATVYMTNGGGADKIMWCITLTATDDTEIIDVDATINSDAQADPSVTLSLSGKTAFAAIGFFSGQNAGTSITPLTNWTDRGEDDFGTRTAGTYSYDTIGSSDVTAGWTQVSDDAVAIAVAVGEVNQTAAARRVIIVN